MKKLLIVLYLISHIATGQPTERSFVVIDPATSFSEVNLHIWNSLNKPGFVHASKLPNGPSFGTIIKPDGPYLQTFTNHTLNFAVNDGAALMSLTPDGNVINNRNTQINGVVIKQLKLTGVTDAYDPLIPLTTNDGLPFETRIPHGLIAGNIISIKLVINADVGFSIGEEYTYTPGHRAAISYDPTFIHVWNYQTNSQFIRNKPFKILITYKN
jgi:hypothetical protein